MKKVKLFTHQLVEQSIKNCKLDIPAQNEPYIPINKFYCISKRTPDRFFFQNLVCRFGERHLGRTVSTFLVLSTHHIGRLFSALAFNLDSLQQELIYKVLIIYKLIKTAANLNHFKTITMRVAGKLKNQKIIKSKNYITHFTVKSNLKLKTSQKNP